MSKALSELTIEAEVTQFYQKTKRTSVDGRQ
jgi:hypothetical protein